MELRSWNLILAILAVTAACDDSNRPSPVESPPVDAPVMFDTAPSACAPPCLATGVFQGIAVAIAVRDGFVYISDNHAKDHENGFLGSVYAVAPDGRATMLAADQHGPRPLIVDATSVYWANEGWTLATAPYYRNDPAIMKAARTGGPAVVIASQADATAPPARSLRIDGDKLYFTTFYAHDSVNRVSVTGGAIEMLARDDYAPDHPRVSATALALHGDDIYWTNSDGAVIKMAKTGGGLTQLVDPVGVSANSIAIYDQSIYFVAARLNGSTIIQDLVKMPLQGGPPVTLVANISSGYGAPIFLEGNDIYFVNSTQVYRVSSAGGTPVKVLSDTNDYAVDEQYIYWAGSNGTVYRKAR